MRFAGTQLTNFIDPTNFDAIGKSSINGRSIENQASMQSEAYVDRAEIKALADIEAAKFGAEATRAQGSAQGQASMFSGLGSMASGLAGGFASMPGVGGGGAGGFGNFGSDPGLYQQSLQVPSSFSFLN
jgi:hypothetical protein